MDRLSFTLDEVGEVTGWTGDAIAWLVENDFLRTYSVRGVEYVSARAIERAIELLETEAEISRNAAERRAIDAAFMLAAA